MHSFSLTTTGTCPLVMEFIVSYTFIPMEVLDENDQVKSQTSEVLNKWRTDYEQIFDDNNCGAYDKEHLEEIADLVQSPDNNMFQKADCTSLNSPITLEEVRSSVYHAKFWKSTGLDNIHQIYYEMYIV